MSELYADLQIFADTYPTFARTWNALHGFSPQLKDSLAHLKYQPRDTDLFGPICGNRQNGPSAYNRLFVSAGIGELLAVRELTFTPKVNEQLPATKKWAGLVSVPGKTIMRDGETRPLLFSDLLKDFSGSDSPLTSLQYSTLLNGLNSWMRNFHTDLMGRPGNYMNTAVVLPRGAASEAVGIVASQPEQIRHLSQYIIEEKMGVRPADYTWPDFEAMASQGINKIIIGHGDIPTPDDGLVLTV